VAVVDERTHFVVAYGWVMRFPHPSDLVFDHQVLPSLVVATILLHLPDILQSRGQLLETFSMATWSLDLDAIRTSNFSKKPGVCPHKEDGPLDARQLFETS